MKAKDFNVGVEALKIQESKGGSFKQALAEAQQIKNKMLEKEKNDG